MERLGTSKKLSEQEHREGRKRDLSEDTPWYMETCRGLASSVKGHHCESLSMNQDLADLGVSASYETGGRGWCALVNTTLAAEVTSVFEEYRRIMLIIVSITHT